MHAAPAAPLGTVADLEAAVSHLHAAYDAMACGVLIVDERGAVVEGNSAAQRILGCSPAEIPRPDDPLWRPYTFTRPDGTPLPCEERPTVAALRTGVAQRNLHLDLVRPDGQQRFISVDAVPMPGADGAPSRVVLSFIDITDHVRAVRKDQESADLLRIVVRNSPVILCACDEHGIITLQEGGGERSPDDARSAIVGASIYDVYRDYPALLEQARRALAGETFTELTEVRGRVYEVHCSPIRDMGGVLRGVMSVSTDITERCRAEQALRASEERFRALSEHAADLIRVIDADAVIRYASPSHQRILGYAPEALVGRRTTDFIHPEDLALLRGSLGSVRIAAEMNYVAEYRVRHADGSWRWMSVSANNRLDDPAIGGLIITARDITERKQMEAALRHQALHDALTGLPNRALLRETIEREISHAPERPMALLLLDLDRFKEVNDTFGHQYGDTLLQRVARRLKDALRASDVVARLGGDEFAVVLPGQHADGAVQMALTLRATLDAPFDVDGQILHVGLSIGIALYPAHGADAEALQRRADVAMYVAKRSQQPYAVYREEQDINTPERLTLIGDLRRAIAQRHLYVHYQPKVELATGRLCGVEALTRWRHPDRGQIAPDRFIPLAEQAGLITPLTFGVLETALEQHARWQEMGLRIGMAVNISSRTLYEAQFSATMLDMLRQCPGPEEWTLEITESALMQDPEHAREVLTRLTDRGMRVAIDDFGTGYSSLGYLKRLPVHEIKIDKSFVIGLGTRHGARDGAIVRAIIALAAALGIAVVAEGVEDRQTWDLLREAGCTLAQGYFLSAPVAAPDLERWICAAAWPR